MASSKLIEAWTVLASSPVLLVARDVVADALRIVQAVDGTDRPPLVVWVDGAMAYVVTVWRPDRAWLGSKSSGTGLSGRIRSAGGDFDKAATREYWHGPVVSLVGAIEALKAEGWVVHVAADELKARVLATELLADAPQTLKIARTPGASSRVDGDKPATSSDVADAAARLATLST